MPRCKDLTVAALIAVAFALLSVAWAGGSPVGAAPDEPAHFIKAYATVDGQLAGEAVAPDPTGHRTLSASWFAVSGRAYRMPARLAPPTSVLCYAFDPDRTADCQDFASAPGDPDAEVLAFTHLATYSPYPYFASGLAMLGAPDFRSAARRGRLASLVLCTIFVGWAAALVRRRGAFALAGLVLAVTPAVVFVSASLNTSGIEITSAICFWCALLVLAREPEPGLAAWGAFGVAGVALALTRPLGAVMLPIVVGAVIVLVGFAPLWGAIRRTKGPAAGCIAVVLLACGASLLWAHFAIPHPHVDLQLAAGSLAGAVRDLPNQVRDIIGIFGYNNTTMPNAAYVLGLVLLGGIGVLALAIGSLRERVAMVGLSLAIVALNLGLAVFVEAQIGFGMQARYVMPLAVGLMLMAGDIVQVHRGRLRQETAGILLAVAYAGTAVLHLTAFVANQHRYAVGISGGWQPLWDSRWSPDGGLGAWLALAIAACLALATAAVVASRHSVAGSRR